MDYQQSKVFQGIGEEEFAQMVECFDAHERHFTPGQTICEYNQRSSQVGILKNGAASLIRIDVYGIRTILETLTEGDMFGEVLAFSGLSEDSTTVVCDKECTILFFEYSHITHPCSKNCDHHAMLLENMFRLISQKTMALSERIEVLSRRTIRDKLLCYFSLQATRQNSHTFELPFSVSALADYICSDRSAMMREMKHMRQSGLIEADGRKITLLLD
jgi:CRP-like cAMP-binding protein